MDAHIILDRLHHIVFRGVFFLSRFHDRLRLGMGLSFTKPLYQLGQNTIKLHIVDGLEQIIRASQLQGLPQIGKIGMTGHIYAFYMGIVNLDPLI